MTTDTALNAWKRWVIFSRSKEENSAVAGLPITLRDSEAVRVYPGIYIEEGRVSRIEIGGVKDGNAWEIEILTKLVTTPGADDQIATSKDAHDALRESLSKHVNACGAEQWLDAQIGLACHEVKSSSPVTAEEDGYRVTTWNTETVCCME